MSNKLNEILSTSCPTKHIKKYLQCDIDEELDVVNNLVNITVSIPTSSMSSTPIMNEHESTKVASLVNNPVSSTPIILTTGMDTRKRLWFENEVQYDTGTKGAEQISLPGGEILVEGILNMTQSEMLSSDDEFSILCVEETGPLNCPFSPITNASWQELGPLVQITQIYTYLQYVIGGQCVQGKAQSVRMPIYGDGNCYFRSISHILSGVEKFHLEVRKAVCEFIKVFDRHLKPFLRRGEGEAYIKDSNMTKTGTWATETEILATAKIMKRDVFTYCQRFPYKHELSWDAFYIDNRGGSHYNAVL